MSDAVLRPQILYVGFFRLPDRNAAAHRVIANAKVLRLLGYDVVLAEIGDSEGRGGPIEQLSDVDGFKCYRLPMKHKSGLENPRLSTFQIRQLMSSLDNLEAVIAYNYPAIPLANIARYCRRRKIACSADVTEWYGSIKNDFNIRRLFKWIDTELRMRIVHKKLDALIVISKYLEDFYRTDNGPAVIRIPPLVDLTDEKWHGSSDRKISSTLRLVYAGSPSASKERLDLAIEAVLKAAKSVPVHLDVVGITKSQFKSIYIDMPDVPANLVSFHGRVSHLDALQQVASADFSVIIRDRSRLTDAGFPTKFVESITLGTPSLITVHPDLANILSNGKNGAIVSIADFDKELINRQINKSMVVDSSIFDFRRYKSEFSVFSSAIDVKK